MGIARLEGDVSTQITEYRAEDRLVATDSVYGQMLFEQVANVSPVEIQPRIGNNQGYSQGYLLDCPNKMSSAMKSILIYFVIMGFMEGYVLKRQIHILQEKDGKKRSLSFI